MDIRYTRCVSEVFGFLKEYECQNCKQSKVTVEGRCSNGEVKMTSLIKKSVSDSVLTESHKNLVSTNKCSCQLIEECVKMESGGNEETTLEHSGKTTVEDSGMKNSARCSESNSDVKQHMDGELQQSSKDGVTLNQFKPNGNICQSDGPVNYSETALKTNGHSDIELKLSDENINSDENAPSESAKVQTNDDDRAIELRKKPQTTNQSRINTAVISEVFNFLKIEKDKLSEIMEGNEELGNKTSGQCKASVMSDVGEQHVEIPVENGTGVVESRQTDRGGTDGTRVVMRKSHRAVSRQLAVGDDPNDSSDEDAGIYDETVRRSRWIRVEEDGQLSVVGLSDSDSLDRKTCDSNGLALRESTPEDVFVRNGSLSPRTIKAHKRSDSCSTTVSEREFKREFSSTKKCLIQRNNSQQEYHRYSCKVYDQEKVITIQKSEIDTDFGLHLLDCQPAFITSVDPGSPAERAGIVEGQIVISVNGVNVLESTHDELLRLIQQMPSVVALEVAFSDYQPVRNIQSTEYEGYMYKLGSSTLVKKWNKRYFILRQDNCLYYYKTHKDADPLGAIPLCGYSILRYLDTNKDFCFKAEKYNARTYYFMTDGRDDLTNWVGKLTEAAARSKKRKDSWLEVSSHNVGLPALEIRRPECTGYLVKCSPRYKTSKKRYCVLKDACLYYYKNMNSFSAQGIAHLHGYTINPSYNTTKRHSFALIPPEEFMRIFYFQAENETDKNRWVDSLIRSIQRWKKVD
ncbi:uncharacterized protein LOC121377434 [Gigantopelta aegis]|uniref:uncharacterized protein LOC121377434 n=1 Tax=Gigantopelta aegis TaxID=1735272 RepID=UPI001B88A2C7|nr:uncharacterized protein LOC121377434 [Gigantopelta aegis]